MQLDEYTPEHWASALNSAEDWRKRAVTSLAIGNGAGLLGFGSMIANSASPNLALEASLPFLFAFAAGAAIASVLPLVAYRQDAGIIAYRTLCLRAVKEIVENTPDGERDEATKEAIKSIEGAGRKYSRFYLLLVRALAAISGAFFLIGILSPIFLTAIGSNPLEYLSRDERSDEIRYLTIIISK